MVIKDNTENLANFYLEILEQEDVTEALEWKVVLEPQQIKQWEAGNAAIAVAPPVFDWEKLFNRFMVVARSCRKWQAGPQPVSDQCLHNLESMAATAKRDFAASLVRPDGQKANWARELGMPLDLLNFLALVACRPFLKSYGQAVLARLPLQDWLHSHCPVCGDLPAMAKLVGQQGQRKLYCGRCETEWRYKRIGCPYCKEDNVSQASFITLEDGQQYRIYLCERCQTYLKTVDERVSGEVDLFCEDLATVALDRIARAEGYRRGDSRHQV
ncbi:formate dehydrogenase accessory protein FdhE [Desulforamulus hydrothermalis]|uniref:Formate dehydrogenase accessory protein n=1 Tax=Desulforamulus hydrothermalis Lam5 = DSM 18033 TaxID=1121428 RepID=K8E0B2_9FIRM|nr:formate dehydrogenase accessory protein FdhE [Desulforamulus hydrothermalis]CCO08974.1 Formate dehydrogenase accessory protein [Desulforamulus hydrothermalis Lam5 = DSM 18033]SHG76049.1 FdhE protein [Desulforamulus hydrothermalis Lam5 = DSM 18033]